MTGALTLRPAQAGEGELLGNLGFSAWADGEISTAGGPDVDRERVRRHFVAFCTGKFGTMLVIEADGRPIGWGAREDGDNYVSDLWILPEAQGAGVGRVLLEALETDIAKAGYGTVELETSTANVGGIRFYERGGYRQVWRKRKFSEALGRDVEKVGLVKPLAPQKD
ncbi:MAG TPA: GNAT family N-acetyltransferase [Devosia sp.]|nr:GNAT family N-acetyltransferase [Devosia sp.]